MRLGQHHRLPVDLAQTGQRLRILTGDADTMPFGQPVHRQKPEVMRRKRVIFARIPQTSHQEHGNLLLLALFFGGGFLVLLALLDDLGLGGNRSGFRCDHGGAFHWRHNFFGA